MYHLKGMVHVQVSVGGQVGQLSVVGHAGQVVHDCWGTVRTIICCGACWTSSA